MGAIIWPERFKPENCPVHAVNSIDIAAPPEKVWEWLIVPESWPQWYANSSNVVIDGPLEPGKRFQWRTFGVTIQTEVQEFVPYERLAWHATGFLLDVYHAWLIEPTPTGCHVVTEETQHGVMPRLQKLFMPRRMEEQHQIWLEGLAAKAVSGGTNTATN
jgi:uncharacterized protein YndB with AHSA1/START domain